MGFSASVICVEVLGLTIRMRKKELTKAVAAMTNGSDEREDRGKKEEEKKKKDISVLEQQTSLSPPLPTSAPLVSRFAGVETTGLTAIELHEMPPEEVRWRMIQTTEKLLKEASQPVRAVCLGCAGMAGMDEAVRAGCVNVYGEIKGENVHIVDGVVAGVGLLVNACKARV